VLLLGPLYHLTDQDDRRRALREARRVLRPGGVLAAAGINRYAALLEQTATTGLAREPVRRAVEGILTSHQLQLPHALGVAHFHTAGELAAEVQEAGFEPAALYSVEGPGWLVLKAVEQAGAAVVDTPVFQAALAAARMADGHTDLDAAGSHFLAIGRRPRRPE
jgi:SAM-dependent methyltransferase